MLIFISGAAVVAALTAGFYFYGRAEYARGRRDMQNETLAGGKQKTDDLNQKIYDAIQKMGARNDDKIDDDGRSWMDSPVPGSVRMCRAANNCFRQLSAAAAK